MKAQGRGKKHIRITNSQMHNYLLHLVFCYISLTIVMNKRNLQQLSKNNTVAFKASPLQTCRKLMLLLAYLHQ